MFLAIRAKALRKNLRMGVGGGRTSFLFVRVFFTYQGVMGQRSIDPQKQLFAIRDHVYFDLLKTLPVASVHQTHMFLINLGLYPGSPKVGTLDEQQHRHFVNEYFLDLRVSPEIGETGRRGWSKSVRMRYLIEKWGDLLLDVAGFYRLGSGLIELHLPKNCALYGYRSRLGFYNGVLCQPMQTEGYFLLSSAKFGGTKAVLLTDTDSAMFDAGVITFPYLHQGGYSAAA
jgi:hypothetical protein